MVQGVLQVVMPIYFHLASHLWIAWLFVVNGLMLTWLLRYRFESFRTLTESLESQILSAFFISVSLNGVILLILDWTSLEFSLARWFLFIIGAALLFTIVLFFNRLRQVEAFTFEASFARLMLYTFVFIVLFYNGAMIEVISDAWWHMSLANKISLESTYSPSLGHLVGLPTRYYPPLWHGNLALANHLSGISIPVFWNSLTAWVAVLKVMAFYLFAFGLSKHRQIALVAAVLFVLLPGLGISYLRVSAWPSHIAYTTWFVMFYVATLVLDDLPDKNESIKQDVRSFLSVAGSKLLILIVLGVLVLFIHKAEILWFAIAWLGYLIAASLSRLLSTKNEYIVERDHYFLTSLYRGVLLFVFGCSLWFAKSQSYPVGPLSDQLLSYLLPSTFALVLFFLDIRTQYKLFSYGLFFVFLVLVLGAVNYTHLYSLFVPELALPKGQFIESSAVAIGYFGGELKVPGWHLQLRSGLLISGALSVPVALFALILKPTKLTIFLAGASCIASLLCLSPYLYHWLQDILFYSSPWRIALVIFHPIVWAFVLVELNQRRKTSGREVI